MKNIVFVFAFLICSVAFGQGISVSGTVIDGNADHSPFAFASVKVKGLDISTETDLNGNYEFSLLEGDYILIFDFIGYESIEMNHVIVGNKKLSLDAVVLKARELNFDLAAREEDR